MRTRMGIPNLSVHRNTRAERRCRDMRKELVAEAKKAGEIKDIAGYAIVTWDEQWGFRASYQWSRTTPSVIVPGFVKGCLERDLTFLDIDSRLEPKPDESG